MPSSPNQKDPFSIQSTIPFYNGAFNTNASNPIQGSNVVSNLGSTSGGAGAQGTGFGFGGATQGTPDYQGAYNGYLKQIQQNPNFSTQNIQSNISAPTFQATPFALPKVDFGSDTNYNSTRDLINNSLGTNTNALNATYDQSNSALDSQKGALTQNANNTFADLAKTKADSLTNTESSYNNALRSNSQLFRDQGTMLGNNLRAQGLADSSANDAAAFGGSRNQLINQTGQRAYDANNTYNSSLNDIENKYTQSYTGITQQLQSAIQDITNQKGLNERERQQKAYELQTNAAQQLLQLKQGFDQYQMMMKYYGSRGGSGGGNLGNITIPQSGVVGSVHGSSDAHIFVDHSGKTLLQNPVNGSYTDQFGKPIFNPGPVTTGNEALGNNFDAMQYFKNLRAGLGGGYAIGTRAGG